MSEQKKRYESLMSKGHSAAWDLAWERAASYYQQALDEIPDDPKALVNLALAWFKLEDYQKSLDLYLLAAKANPNNPVPLEKAATIYRLLDQKGNAAKFAVQAAENYLKEKNIDKAIENWSLAISNDPENLHSHSRLAAVYERLGRKSQAAREYFHVASLMQHSGKQEKAIEAIERALSILPDSEEARQSKGMIRAGTLLPKPERPRGGTGALGKTEKKPTPKSAEIIEEASDSNAIEEAYSVALSNLAGLFFEKSNDDAGAEPSTSSDMEAIVDGSSGSAFTKNADQTIIMPHLGKAVEMQTIGDIAQAAEALKQAINAGLVAPAAHYCLGLMWVKTQRLESAVRSLQHVITHPDYALATHLLLGDIFFQREEYKKAAVKYLEALRTADAMIAPAEHVNALRELYDPLIEHQSREKDDDLNQQLSEKISKLLIRPNWRQYLINARRELGEQDSDSTPVPIAELMLETSVNDVAVAMNIVRRLARDGHLGAALDQILYSLEHAPSYLPLHIVLGEVLISKDLIPAAVQKFKVIAHAYSIRGEAHRAVDMLKRIIELTPLAMDVRQQLVNDLIICGKIDEATAEIIQSAEIHYNLAELDKARDAYSNALDLTSQTQDPTLWTVRILHRIANIDRQSLEWRKARENYDRISALAPSDVDAYSNSIDLSIQLKEQDKALESLDQFVSFANKNQRENEALVFLKKITEEQAKQPMVYQRLAAQYQRMKFIPEALEYLDKAGDLLLDAGNKTGARKIIQHIIKLDPSRREYKELLDTL